MSRIGAVLFNLLVLCVLAGTAYGQELEAALVAFVIAQLVVFASHLLVLRAAGTVDLLDGLNILNVGFLFHFTLAPILLVRGVIEGFYTGLWDPADIPRALVLIQLVCVAVQAGYYLRVRLPAAIPFGKRVPSTGRIALFGAVLLGLVVVVGAFPRLPRAEWLAIEVSSSGPVMGFLALIFTLPYILVMLVPIRGSAGRAALVGGGLLLVLYVSVFTGIGSKQGVGAVVISLAIYRNYFVRRLSLRGAAAIVLIGAGIAVYMNYLRVGALLQTGLTTETANALGQDNRINLMQAGVASTLTPFEAFLVVLNTFPDVLPFQGGLRLFEDMVYPVFPRLLFPDKPTVYWAAFFWEYLRGFLSLDNKIYEAISLPGHMYLDFGVPGLIVCGLITGIIQRVFYRVLIGRARSRGSVCLYGMIIAQTVIASRAFMWTTGTIIINIAIPAAAVYALHKSTRPVRVRSGGLVLWDAARPVRLPGTSLARERASTTTRV